MLTLSFLIGSAIVHKAGIKCEGTVGPIIALALILDFIIILKIIEACAK